MKEAYELTEEDSLFQEEPEKFTDMSVTNTRYYMLLFSCLLCIGSYFVYNSPETLESQLKTVT
jgi:hypothetical protein